ncbi:MAG: hypothetical protein QOF91_1058 [Alphaproteobacteria bacterium]|jgi:hypothetical protein|nr:hypothetical protein [Alphaproteobacteria bacterium]
MRDLQPHPVTLFDGEHLSEGCRGRVSQTATTKPRTRWSAVVIGVLLLGITTAAAAVTVNRISRMQDAGLSGESLPSNFIKVPGMGGFEEALY